MKKIIYLMRHSEVYKGINHNYNSDNLLETNMKSILSINGERMASDISKLDEFSNLDLVVSSNYVRAMSTAKYFVKDGISFVVSDLFGERKHGINSWDELPEDFERKQFEDFNFKVGFGECLNEVKGRMLKGLDLLLKEDFNNILVVGHGTAIASLLSNWCEINYGGEYKFKGNVFFNRRWNYMECFKLEFEDNELVNIENLNFNL
ncbi:MAG: histidine phosphatase family protein [Bacilli bacterium]|nr:histidine phosphatase family protein [Bacilli bacterium]